MALKEGDLKNTILKNISIDEFEPKTGEAQDVMVVGLYLNLVTTTQNFQAHRSACQHQQLSLLSQEPNLYCHRENISRRLLELYYSSFL